MNQWQQLFVILLVLYGHYKLVKDGFSAGRVQKHENQISYKQTVPMVKINGKRLVPYRVDTVLVKYIEL